MIVLMKNEKVFKKLSINEIDPISLDSYRSIIHCKNTNLAVLICKNTNNIYKASDIISMRYVVMFNTIHVNYLKDPISREEVKDIFFFSSDLEHKNTNKILSNKIVFQNNTIRMLPTRKFIFQYICNERELFKNDKYKSRILGFEKISYKTINYAILTLIFFSMCLLLNLHLSSLMA